MKELRVRSGDQVARGQTLALLSDYEIEQAALREAEAEVRVAESELAQSREGDKRAAIAAQQSVVDRQDAVVQKRPT